MLKRNYILAIPTVVMVFITSFVALGVMTRGVDPTLNPTPVLVMAFISLMLNFFAHGVTLAMAREAIETGKTSLGTARFIAWRLAGTFMFASIIMAGLIALGSVMFLVPGMVAGLLLMFTLPSIVVDNVGAFEGIQRSYLVVKANLKDSLMLFGFIILVGFVLGIINMILGAFTLIGQLVGVGISGFYGGYISIIMIRAYKTSMLDIAGIIRRG